MNGGGVITQDSEIKLNIKHRIERRQRVTRVDGPHIIRYALRVAVMTPHPEFDPMLQPFAFSWLPL